MYTGDFLSEYKYNEKFLKTFKVSNGKNISYYSLPSLEEEVIGISKLPFSIRIILESLLRNEDGKRITEDDIKLLASWNPENPTNTEISFRVSRILMQDFTGVPAVVDLATMRDFVVNNGKSPNTIQPQIPVDLIIDHSIQIDVFNVPDAIKINQEKEFERNGERYHFLKWANNSFTDFGVYPPSAGICHQINLEYLGKCVVLKTLKESNIAFPDTLIGTDSHTTMINGLGIVGFGVGGIEAEAAMLGQPVSFPTPKVLGVKLTGALKESVTATDFALTLTRLLRKKGVVGMFVEFFGEGVKKLSLPDRATLSNMCPEYGATIAIFPPDEETLNYMRLTGRKKDQIELVKSYYQAQEMFNINYNTIKYSDTLVVNLRDIKPSVSGPDQPKEQIPLEEIKNNFDNISLNEKIDTTEDLTSNNTESIKKIKCVELKYDDGYITTLYDGDVIISSLTSCTNTSNPSVMIAAGLLAKKAVELGLKVNTRKVKTSLGPGSRVVIDYLTKSGLLKYLTTLGYGLVGYGCTTCIGNSGPLIEKQSEAINNNNITAVSVLSGNRNFEARIHRDVHANYLMSPPLLIAFGIAGTVRIDLTKEPLGKGSNGDEVYLKDIWPSQYEINSVMDHAISKDMFEKAYNKNIFNTNKYWNELTISDKKQYIWNKESTYIKKPPFFENLDTKKIPEIKPIENAAVIGVFGDSLSTDHISPAGAIGINSPAGKYLKEHNVNPRDFNTYGSRRGNHEVMMRGTFANNRIKNLLVDGMVGGYTKHFPSNEQMSIYDAAVRYKKEGRTLVVFGGIEYGSGSSRDWAAKGPKLLGVKAVIAKSFERIHRSNLIGMGIAPLQFKEEEDAESLKIDFSKSIKLKLHNTIIPRNHIKMLYYTKEGDSRETLLLLKIDTIMEMEYYRYSGILNYVLNNILNQVSYV